MTPNQVEIIKKKIKRIKLTLSAEKRKHGDFDDSRGLRYVPPHYYIQIGDMKGALNYFKWYSLNFPDDLHFPDFLFEWIIVLFKNGKMKEAEQKVIETFYQNTYLFDKFFNRPIQPIAKKEMGNWQIPAFTECLPYNCRQTELADFSEWLEKLLQTDKIQTLFSQYIESCIEVES